MEPNFVEILSLHSKINNASASKIQNLVHKFNAKMMKELLLIYFNFFFTSSNKTKYFHSNHSNSSIHLSILNLSTKTLKKTNLFKHSSIFNKLPQLLLSQCVSFLHQQDRANLCRVNLLFLKASSQSIAKYHVKITNQFIRQELIKEPNLFNYNNVGSLEIYRYLKAYGLRSRFLRGKAQNYKANLLKITSKPLTSYISKKCKFLNGDIIDKNIKYVDNVTIEAQPTLSAPTGMKDILLKAKYVSARRAYYINHRYLWVHSCNNSTSKDLNISNCLINESNLLHLDLAPTWATFLNDLDEYHPIYWLWNIPTLQSCKLPLTLPIAKPFESQCNKLLSSINMINKAKKQKDFKTLDIRLHFVDSSWFTYNHQNNFKIRGLKDNKYCLKDYATFLKYIFKLYPHLTSFKCNTGTYPFSRGKPDCFKMDGFDLTNISFKSLQHINISLLTVNNATHLLSKLKSHKQLQTLKIKILTADVDTTNKINGHYYFIKETINDFVDDICQFLQNHSRDLHYFGIDVSFGCGLLHKCLSKTYWNPYHKYLQFILNMIENGNGFDGCLELMIPSGIPISFKLYAACTGPDPAFIKKRYEWNKINIEGSLKVAQLLSKMQTSIHQQNESLKDTTCYEKKLVMRMPQLQVYPAHKKFLKFWFNDKNLCNEDCSKFVMY